MCGDEGSEGDLERTERGDEGIEEGEVDSGGVDIIWREAWRSISGGSEDRCEAVGFGEGGAVCDIAGGVASPLEKER